LGLCFIVALVQAGTGRAQAPPGQPVDSWQRSIVGRDVADALYSGAETVDSGLASPTPRILMFRMLPGFLSDPPYLSGFDDPVDNSAQAGNPGTGSVSDGFILSFGNDNPYFDPRRPGDPGGVGFVRIHSQLQVVDSGNTSVCLGLRAWTPAGLENGGVQQGSTVFAPGIGIFQDLGAGSALHGFVDQDLHGGYHQGPMRCGMAVDCPLTVGEGPISQGVFCFVQALGNYDYANGRLGRAMNWELVPGLHWRFSDTLWMSLGASRSSMLTCWWHF